MTDQEKSLVLAMVTKVSTIFKNNHAHVTKKDVQTLLETVNRITARMREREVEPAIIGALKEAADDLAVLYAEAP
jgi:hypothetical protein